MVWSDKYWDRAPAPHAAYTDENNREIELLAGHDHSIQLRT